MTNEEKPGRHAVSDLRTKYFPKNRIGHGLISLAPWLNVVLLLMLFMMLDGKFVTVQQGIVVELPQAPFAGGSRSGLIAVVLSVESTVPGEREETVFFDDARYLVRSGHDMDKLRNAFSVGANSHPDSDLVVKADKRVQYGTIMMLCEMAQAVGIKNVNLASKQRVDAEGTDTP